MTSFSEAATLPTMTVSTSNFNINDPYLKQTKHQDNSATTPKNNKRLHS
jgi:hypothetical protein